SRKLAAMGAIAYLEKPVSRETLEGAFAHMHHFLDRKVKMLLIVEDDQATCSSVTALLGEGTDIEVSTASTVEDAWKLLRTNRYDSMIVALMLESGSSEGFKLIEDLRLDPDYKDLPIIVYTSKDLTKAEENRLKRDVEAVILKADLGSSDRLVAESVRF